MGYWALLLFRANLFLGLSLPSRRFSIRFILLSIMHPLPDELSPSKKTVQIDYQASYCTWGTLGPATQRIWVACHGYGQLAGYFIKKFARLDPAAHYVIAPQGLSKHYLAGFAGRVGAVWMTREDRLIEIANYLTYLDKVWHTETAGVGLSDKEIYCLGFSQGASTICRWVAHAHLPYTKLILWAGEMPPDVLAQLPQTFIPHRDLVYVHGDQDELIKPGEVEKQLGLLAGHGLYPQMIRYTGSHSLDAGVVASL